MAIHRWPHQFSAGLWGTTLGGYARTVFNSGFLMPVDVDEFVYDDLRGHAAEMESLQAIYATGWFVDRFAPGGRLPPFVADRPISEQFPVKCEVTKLLCGGANIKVVMTRWPYWGHIHELGGTPEENGRRHPRLLAVHHYKWNDQVIERMEKRTVDLEKDGAQYVP